MSFNDFDKAFFEFLGVKNDQVKALGVEENYIKPTKNFASEKVTAAIDATGVKGLTEEGTVGGYVANAFDNVIVKPIDYTMNTPVSEMAEGGKKNVINAYEFTTAEAPKVGQKFAEGAQAVAEGAQAVAKATTEAVESAPQKTKEIIQETQAVIEAAPQKTQELIQGTTQAAIDAAKVVSEAATPHLQVVSDKVEPHLKAVSEAATPHLQAVSEGATRVLEETQKNSAKFMEDAQKNSAKFMEETQVNSAKFMEETQKNSAKFIEETQRNSAQFFEQVKVDLPKNAEVAQKAIAENAQKAIEDIGKNAEIAQKQMAENAQKAIADLGPKASQLGKDISQLDKTPAAIYTSDVVKDITRDFDAVGSAIQWMWGQSTNVVGNLGNELSKNEIVLKTGDALTNGVRELEKNEMIQKTGDAWHQGVRAIGKNEVVQKTGEVIDKASKPLNPFLGATKSFWEDLAQAVTQKEKTASQEIAAQAIAMIDHTSLGLDDTEAQIQALIDSAVAVRPHTAALCVYPKWVPFLRSLQEKEPAKYPRTLRIATVVNFPKGDEPLAKVIADTKKTVSDGADEVDMVINYQLLKQNKTAGAQEALQLVKAVRAECPEGQVLLKVIIESGELQAKELIEAACDAALEGGADFVKTSTGKVTVNATPEAASIMLSKVAEYQRPWGRSIGFKAAGGVKTLEQVQQYLDIAAKHLCGGNRSWLDMRSFRFGASSLLAGLRAQLYSRPVIARQGISLIDHTSLGLEDTESMIRLLMDAAVASKPHTAALCVYPKFVPFIRKLQAEQPDKYPRSLRVATVVNFPLGDAPQVTVVSDTLKTVADGADEVDMVIDYNALKRNKQLGKDQALQLVKAVRAVCPEGQVLLKVIIESGELQTPDLIAAACDAAIEGGADFVKTSTGKVKVNATLEAAQVMLERVAAYKDENPWGRNIGFKAAGGVKTVDQVEEYLKLAARILCNGHLERVDMNNFRFGASSLLAGLKAEADGDSSAPQVQSTGY